MEKSPQELYKEREKRFMDAVQLKVPDRVPVVPCLDFFPAIYAGINFEESMYDMDKAWMAWKKTALDLDADMYWNSYISYPGKGLEALGYKILQWPGNGLPAERMYQFVEGEYMKANEYDEFLADPSDYLIRTYYPRICGTTAGLQKLSPIHSGFWQGIFGLVGNFGDPEVQESLRSLMEAGTIFAKWFDFLGEFNQELESLGYPNALGAATYAPYDIIGDTFRGTRGVMLDMYRNPDKLLEAVDMVTPWALEAGVNGAKASGNPRVWIWLHKGCQGFMNDEQFQKFYWPGLKKLIMGLIEEDLVPYVYIEGDYTCRLETIADVPKGKVVYHFEQVDIYKAKEILGGIACISGNVPNALLCTGTPEEVKEYCKKLIDVLGKDGGYIMDSGACIDEAKPENIKAMIDFTKEYGVYR